MSGTPRTSVESRGREARNPLRTDGGDGNERRAAAIEDAPLMVSGQLHGGLSEPADISEGKRVQPWPARSASPTCGTSPRGSVNSALVPTRRWRGELAAEANAAAHAANELRVERLVQS
jgi:hypothetical protein